MGFADATDVTTLQSLLAFNLKQQGYRVGSLLRTSAQTVSMDVFGTGVLSGIVGVAFAEAGLAAFCRPSMRRLE